MICVFFFLHRLWSRWAHIIIILSAVFGFSSVSISMRSTVWFSRNVLDEPLCLNGKLFDRIWHAQQFNSIICFAFVRHQNLAVFLFVQHYQLPLHKCLNSLFLSFVMFSTREHLTRRWQHNLKSILFSLHPTNCFSSIRRSDALMLKCILMFSFHSSQSSRTN